MFSFKPAKVYKYEVYLNLYKRIINLEKKFLSENQHKIKLHLILMIILRNQKTVVKYNRISLNKRLIDIKCNRY
jgi:hypothetical protein